MAAIELRHLSKFYGNQIAAVLDANLEIHDRRQLEAILTSIRRVAGVYGVERVYQT